MKKKYKTIYTHEERLEVSLNIYSNQGWVFKQAIQTGSILLIILESES